MAEDTAFPRATRRGLMTGAAGLLAARGARAQGGDAWRILVNFPPGGLLDGTARLIAERSQREGRVPTVVENRPGAGGNIGAAAAARAKPDGRTVLASIDTPFTVNPYLYRDMGFDPEKDLVPVALLSSFPLVASGTEGYRTAEVTLGGVDTREVSSKTFESRRSPGLYFIGEVLDVTGWLGGYNFQWAWASGQAAGGVA